MFVTKEDIVILAETDQVQLKDYVGKEWKVEAVMDAYHPASAIISKDNLRATVHIRNLEVKPPESSPFKHNEKVRIQKDYSRVPGIPYRCNTDLVGLIGFIRGYDTRSGFYHVRCQGGRGWFPIQSLLPMDFKGERFFYPHESVKYKGMIKIISNVKPSRFSFGQLLLIDGIWIPSTDVEPNP